MAEEEQQQVEAARHEGKVSATVRGATADQVWPLLADFCNVHRWIPGVSTCRLEGGVAGEPGCVRYCVGKGEPADGGDVPWAREKLTVIDHAGRKLRYVVFENNIGWKNYEAALEVVEGEEGGEGCIIEWCFRMEPVAEGNGCEVVPFVTSALEGMVKTMEEFLAAAAAAGSDVQELVCTVVA
ncbi:lachrymatory-factor synthase-like [Nymphaea colorata]|uniref:Bet v I/Major latex protein domain-containing protein n=1 Tax=Nymphaea colorata TaxID=210225 RepID=A0A5K1E8G4_9MAGN|nr:lachrymatory-factor synthase-like [Nymphaea colorata]